MQTFTLLSPTAMSSAITGASSNYRHVVSSVGVAVIEVKQTSATNPSGSCTVEIQGSLDGNDWVVLYSTSTSSLTRPLGVSPDWGAGNGGYRTIAQVIQTMPIMRVCTSASITNGAHSNLSVIVANG